MDSLISACVDPVLKSLKDRVLKHLCFVVEAGGNVESLGRMATKLEDRLKDVRERIQADEPSGKRPTHEAAAWLADADALLERARSIREEYGRRDCLLPGASTCSLNCFSNHHLGRHAAEELSNVEDAMRFFEGGREITREAPRQPVQEMSAAPLAGAGADDEIKHKVEAALGFLRDDARGAMGLWGMGGVGKTTVLKHVNNSLAKDPLRFHLVVFLVASRGCSVEKIQEGLREKLGLKDRSEIFGHLSSKSFVLLLDDLWDPLDLEQVGIPLPLGTVDGPIKRKLILTTRSQQVCASMGALARRVDCLSRDASRRLFWDKAGAEATSSHPLIRELGDKIADECDGLPLALVTIGSAMAGTQTVQVWQNAVTQLRHSRPSKVPGMVDPLTRLKFSYDHLKNPTERQCFLHCALWPEDCEIHKEHLIECWMGHGLLGDDADELPEVYDQGYAIIDALQKACLLECVETSYCLVRSEWVKLHDVIRDMALWIAGDCGRKQKKWMVLDQRTKELPHEPSVWSEVHKLSASGGRFEGFPSGIGSCPNLSTLVLHRCSILASSRMWGYSPGLTFLSLSGCILPNGFPIEICNLIKLEYINITFTNVPSLPSELRNLRNLKYLIAYGTKISHLPCELVANLVSLFYVDLLPTEYISQSSIIDDLSRVNGRLRALGISVSTVSDIKKLVQLDKVCIRRLHIQRMEGISSLQLLSSDVLGTKHMHSNLIEMCISNCVPSFEELVVDEEHHFSILDFLLLENLPGLKEVIWKGVEPQNVLPNLQTVSITNCPQLKHITWIANLPCLERLDLDDCENMINLIWVEAVVGRAESYMLGFPSLRILNLSLLPNLESICDSVLAFPSLGYLTVRDCERLTKLPFQSPLSLRNIKKITGENEWWNNLEMDVDMRNFLQPFYFEYA